MRIVLLSRTVFDELQEHGACQPPTTYRRGSAA
jgi:hypothetical protein